MNIFQKIVKGIQSLFTKPKVPESEYLNSQPEPDPLEGFKNENRPIIEEANRRMKELEDLDLDRYSRAYQDVQLSGGTFDIDDLTDRQSIIRETLRAESFLNNETSRIEVASAQKKLEIGSETVDELKDAGIDLYKTRIHEDNVVKDFWEAVDRVREEDDLGGRLAALSYSKDQAYGYAFNIWVQSNFDQIALKQALEDFVREQNKIHEKTFEAQKGKALFRSGDDW